MENGLKFDHIISLHHIKQYPDKIDPKSLITCYSTRRYKSFEAQFSTKDDKLKLKVLNELISLFYSPLEITYALLSSELLETLCICLETQKNDLKIREAASKVVEQICTEKSGQEFLLKSERLYLIIWLLNSQEQEIKINAFKTVCHFSEHKGYRQLFLKSGILMTIFENMRNKNSEIIVHQSCLILKNLLDEGGVSVTCMLFEGANKLILVASAYRIEIVWAALDCLVLMSQCNRSKVDMIRNKVHEEASGMFFKSKFEKETVQRLFLLLTNLGQIVSAKNYLVENGFVKILLEFLHQFEPNKDLFLNTILLLTVLAEHVDGRRELIVHTEKIKPFCSELFYPDSFVYAEGLLEVIYWQT